MDLSLLNQISYTILTCLLLVLYTAQIFLRWYCLYYELPQGKQFGFLHVMYQRCGWFGTLVACVRCADPFGQNGIYSSTILFMLQDVSTLCCLLGAFATIYETSRICYHEFDIVNRYQLSTSPPPLPNPNVTHPNTSSKIRQFFQWALITLWILAAIVVTVMDVIMFIAKRYWFRATAYLGLGGPFFGLFIALQWTGHDLTKLYRHLFRNQTRIPPSLAANVRHKYNRYMAFKSTAQVLIFVAIVDGVARVAIYFKNHSSDDNEYQMEDTIEAWMLNFAGMLGLWYCWISLHKICPFLKLSKIHFKPRLDADTESCVDTETTGTIGSIQTTPLLIARQPEYTPAAVNEDDLPK